MTDPRPYDRTPDDAADAPFVPLRLAMQPSGLSMILGRPSVLVGRHSSADVRLPLPDVSRHHCRFLFGDGRWQVCDLKSLNGVYVNGRRVERSGLKCGDAVRIGGFDFTVEYLTAACADEIDDRTAEFSSYFERPRRKAS